MKSKLRSPPMAETTTSHKQNFRNPADLKAERRSALSKLDQIQLYRRYLKYENYRLKVQHRNGLDGLEFARKRSELLDHVLRQFFADASVSVTEDPKPSRARKRSSHPVTLVAFGGYGRSTLNVGSDVDLLFLCPDDTTKLADDTEAMVQEILQMLWDVGFKVGHAARSIRESIKIANEDHATKTAMLDMRFITGDLALYEEFADRFQRECIIGKEKEYLKTRQKQFTTRHEKNLKTVYVQEPNVKEGCGGASRLPERSVGDSSEVREERSWISARTTDSVQIRLSIDVASLRIFDACSQRIALLGKNPSPTT